MKLRVLSFASVPVDNSGVSEILDYHPPRKPASRTSSALDARPLSARTALPVLVASILVGSPLMLPPVLFRLLWLLAVIRR